MSKVLYRVTIETAYTHPVLGLLSPGEERVFDLSKAQPLVEAGVLEPVREVSDEEAGVLVDDHAERYWEGQRRGISPTAHLAGAKGPRLEAEKSTAEEATNTEGNEATLVIEDDEEGA